jgi:glycolate dehydrogenase iron-sulfur subunit
VPTRKTQEHLDRCLTCRSCETTCPSGVQYGHLVDIGRKLVDARVPRSTADRAVRWGLKEGLPSPLFAPALRVGQAVRGLLPPALRDKVPARQAAGAWPVREHARKVLLLAGCVQPAMAPNINPATARVLDAAGIQAVVATGAGCCGAVKFHLNDQDGARDEMRRNIDAWWPLVEGGVEAIVINASGCGVTVKEYGYQLKDDPDYAGKAACIAALARDLGELLPDVLPHIAERLAVPLGTFAYHPPCTLQHGQKLRGGVETQLRALGFDIQVAGNEAHLCCGSAGTYSVLQPSIAHQLRDRKLEQLEALRPLAILSANIGCITHLQSGSGVPVRHWVEALDEALRGGAMAAEGA